MKNKFKNQSGFTLVEMLIAISLFIVVVTISIGALLSIFDANKKAQATKTVVDNLNLSIEDMSRIVRFGGYYYCNNVASSNQTSWRNCPGDNYLSVTFNNSRIVYRLSGNAIQRSNNGGSTYTSITSPETVIQYMRFYVFGSDPLDSVQPYVIAVIRGYVGNEPTTQSVFSIETLMSQRTLDFN